MRLRTIVAAAGMACLAACGGPSETATDAGGAEGSQFAEQAAAPPPAFGQCISCHSMKPGLNGVGPSLHGIVGAKAASVPGYAYSAALRNSGLTWDEATLDAWLAAPMKMVPGTKMVFPGMPDPARRQAVIDYLGRREMISAERSLDEVRDRLAIADRLAATTQAGDARKADAYAACFTEDGVLDLTSGGGEAIAGREAIRAWMNAPSVIGPASDRPAGFISHHLTTSSVALTGPDTATARTYWLVTSPSGLDHNGYYDDRFRKVDGDWLLDHRKPRTLWFAPDSQVRRGS